MALGLSQIPVRAPGQNQIARYDFSISVTGIGNVVNFISKNKTITELKRSSA